MMAFDMNKAVLFISCIIIASISGCSGGPGVNSSISGIYRDAPEWVIASELSDGVSGSGKAIIDDDYNEAYKEAEENAKAALYSRLNKKIRACLFDIFKKNNSLENEAFARIGESIAITAAGGFKIKASWRSSENGIFVLVVSDVDAIRDAFKKNLMDFLNIRKPDGFDPENPKIQEDLEKYANMHFRHFRTL